MLDAVVLTRSIADRVCNFLHLCIGTLWVARYKLLARRFRKGHGLLYDVWRLLL